MTGLGLYIGFVHGSHGWIMTDGTEFLSFSVPSGSFRVIRVQLCLFPPFPIWAIFQRILFSGGLMPASQLDELSLNTIRFLSADAVQKANSGHPGLPMGAAAMAYVLWTRFLKHNPTHPQWINRDRFVLSGGHGSMLLYSLLHLTGYDLPMSEVQNFRQWGSKTPGHPESHLTPGVEATTGPLGQGISNAVG